MHLLFAAPTAFTLEALKQVRNPHDFKWYAIPLLAIAVYIYSVEIERGRFDIVAAGLAVLGADAFNEMVNALVLHFTKTAALWTETGPGAYQLTVGLNLDSVFLFAIGGIAFAKLLPAGRTKKLLGMPNRFALALGLSLVSVGVEEVLRAAGVFHWHYWFWNALSFPLIVVFGYLWFYVYAAYVFDAPPARRAIALGTLWGINVAMIAVFGVVLGWLP
jgi:hypothetical protein